VSRPRAFVAAILGLLLTLFAAASATAHTRSESNALWEVNGGDVDLVMTLPELEGRRLGAGGARPSDATVEVYLAARVYPVEAGKRCPLVPPIGVLAAASGFRKYDLTFKCPSGRDLSIHSDAFFDVVPSHVMFAQIQNAAAGDFAEQLITADHRSAEVTGGESTRLKDASFLDFIGMGVMHIFTGVDHMSFLLGLILISRRLKDLVFVVTGFTIGHSLTLALAVTGVIRPHAEFIDALVALTIALIGAENLAVATGRSGLVALVVAAGLGVMWVARLLGFGSLPSLLILGAGLFGANYMLVSGQVRDAGRLRMIITLLFGLIHGFGFAADLLQMQIPTLRLAELLVGFNLGVEIGQLSLVLAVTAGALLLGRLRWAPPRAIVTEVAAAGLIGIGAYWFLGRSFV
jgi:hypothetical protein